MTEHEHEDTLADFIGPEKIRLELTKDELQLLLHFAAIGQNHMHVRNNYGDRAVAAELDPVMNKLFEALL